jgi:hypothetical protein
MPSKARRPSKKFSRAETTVLGRSVATGRKVLKPAASSTAAVTMEKACEAVRGVLEKKT